jgi:tetratricopeptide (TPR) repeat protein
VAWHWERAGRRLEAAEWSFRAAGFALRTDIGEALRRWRATVHLLEDVEPTPEALQIGVRTRIRLLQFGARTGVESTVLERLEVEGRALAERLGDPVLSAMMELVSGTVRAFAGDVEGFLARCLKIAEWGERTADPDVRAAMWFPAALALTWVGPLGQGLAWADQVVDVCAGNPDRGAALLGYSVLGRTLQFRSGLLARMGRLPEAAADLEQAVALARARGETELLGWALAMLPLVAWLKGEETDTSAAAGEAVRLAEETGDVVTLVMALESMALSHLAAGRPAEAADVCEHALAAAREKRSGLFAEASVLAHLASARLAAGDPAAATATADEAVEVSRRQGARVHECLALLTRAQVMRATGGAPNAILADLDAALVLVKETGAAAYQPFIREELGRLRSDENELREALQLYSAIGATGHARRLEAELAGSRVSQPAADEEAEVRG